MRKTFALSSSYSIGFLWILMLVCSSCNNKSDNGNTSLNDKLLPSASGLTGEVILIMDSAKWEGALGDAIRDTYRSAFEGLPQDEPRYNLKFVSPRKFNSVLKKVRNLIFVAAMDGDSYEDKLMRSYFSKESLAAITNNREAFFFQKKNIYSKGQQVIYLFNRNEDQLITKIKENKEMLQAFSYKSELERLSEGVFKIRESIIEKEITKDHGFRLKIPKGFELAKNIKNFVWLRMIEPEYEKSAFIYYRPYKKENVFSDIQLLREEITQTYITDIEKPELYLTYQDIIPFDEKEINFKGKYAKEVRGLWKLSDISGGGPFLSYVFVDEKKQRLYYIEGYTYAPGMKKRNFMMELEVMLNSFSFNG